MYEAKNTLLFSSRRISEASHVWDVEDPDPPRRGCQHLLPCPKASSHLETRFSPSGRGLARSTASVHASIFPPSRSILQRGRSLAGLSDMGREPRGVTAGQEWWLCRGHGQGQLPPGASLMTSLSSHPRCPSRTGNRVTANVPEAAHSMTGLRSVQLSPRHDGSGHVKISGSHPRSQKQPSAPPPTRLSHVLPGSSYTFLGRKATFGDFAKVHAEIQRHGSSPGLSGHPVLGPGDAQGEKGGHLGKTPNMT